MMSLLSAISLRSSWRAAFTWCQTLYVRQQRMLVLAEISRTCSDYERIYKNDTANNANNWTTRKIDRKGKRKNKLPRKLFKDRVITEEDRAAEMEDTEFFRHLPESERFGTGVGKFIEYTVSVQNVPGMSKKQSVLPKNWSDRFGTMGSEIEQRKMEKSSLAENERYWDELVKENEETAHFYHHIRLARYNRRHIPHWYARRIIKLGKKGQVREAIEVFEKWMITRDRVKPTGFEFAVMIKLLAEVGYTEKAFYLHKLMGKLKIYCPDQVYSSLFNACANSPWPENALKLANSLHTNMLVKGISPNYITYLAMIKAYGMNGDLNTAFRLADEAIELNVDNHLLNNLLCSCVSDKEAGFRHAIVVWRKFRKLGIHPTLESYNLLLRSLNECGIGDPKLVEKLLGKTERRNNEYVTDNGSARALESKQSLDDEEESRDEVNRKVGKRKFSRKNVEDFKQIDNLLTKYNFTEEENQIFDGGDIDLLEGRTQNTDIDNTSRFERSVVDSTASKEWWQLDLFENTVIDVADRKSELDVVSSSDISLPNILDPNENFSSVIRIEAVKTRQDRLALIGGMRGILNAIEAENLKPDHATYTQLAQVIPWHLEDLLIDEMWANGVRPDIVFYNILIRKQVRSDRNRVWELYSRLKHEDLVPDVKTFSCVALACKQKAEGLALLDDMMAAGVMPNKFTMTALLSPSRYDFDYMKLVLKKMQELGIKPDMHFIELIERKIMEAKERLVKMERNKLNDSKEKMSTERFKWHLQGFLNFYDKWSQHNIVEEKEHPWKHFMEVK